MARDSASASQVKQIAWTNSEEFSGSDRIDELFRKHFVT
jgi:hypothetical protein